MNNLARIRHLKNLLRKILFKTKAQLLNRRFAIHNIQRINHRYIPVTRRTNSNVTRHLISQALTIQSRIRIRRRRTTKIRILSSRNRRLNKTRLRKGNSILVHVSRSRIMLIVQNNRPNSTIVHNRKSINKLVRMFTNRVNSLLIGLRTNSIRFQVVLLRLTNMNTNTRTRSRHKVNVINRHQHDRNHIMMRAYRSFIFRHSKLRTRRRTNKRSHTIKRILSLRMIMSKLTLVNRINFPRHRTNRKQSTKHNRRSRNTSRTNSTLNLSQSRMSRQAYQEEVQ